MCPHVIGGTSDVPSGTDGFRPRGQGAREVKSQSRSMTVPSLPPRREIERTRHVRMAKNCSNRTRRLSPPGRRAALKGGSGYSRLRERRQTSCQGRCRCGHHDLPLPRRQQRNFHRQPGPEGQRRSICRSEVPSTARASETSPPPPSRSYRRVVWRSKSARLKCQEAFSSATRASAASVSTSCRKSASTTNSRSR